MSGRSAQGWKSRGKGRDDASVSAQRSTEPQLRGRRLKLVDGLYGKWDAAGTNRQYKKGEGTRKCRKVGEVLTRASLIKGRSAPQALLVVLCLCRVRVRHQPNIPVSIFVVNFIGILHRKPALSKVTTGQNLATSSEPEGCAVPLQLQRKIMECVTDAKASSVGQRMNGCHAGGKWWMCVRCVI